MANKNNTQKRLLEDQEEISDPFWLDSPNILFDKDRLSEFYISVDMTKDEKLNSIMRFGCYVSLIMMLYQNDIKYILIGILIGFVTFIIHTNDSENSEDSEGFDDKGKDVLSNVVTGEMTDKDDTVVDSEDTVKPTINNPFMNPSVFDNPVTFRASKYSDNTPESNKLKKDIYNKFSFNLFKDVSDIYDTNNGFRQFYTVPDNLNNYEEFKNFIHGDFKYSAKENTYDGFKNLYDPLQSKRHNY